MTADSPCDGFGCIENSFSYFFTNDKAVGVDKLVIISMSSMYFNVYLTWQSHKSSCSVLLQLSINFSLEQACIGWGNRNGKFDEVVS